ncbi:MAG: Dabb family protein [Pirellulales bacterium]|nr:Dabb family protein [Planctomycetales bacterium]
MPQVKHVVLVKLKPDVTDAQVDEMMTALAGLKDKIPGLLDFSGGAYSSPEGLNKGFSHGFVMTFADEPSRDTYLPHPAHEEVKSIVFGLLDGGMDGVVAFDWLVT